MLQAITIECAHWHPPTTHLCPPLLRTQEAAAALAQYELLLLLDVRRPVANFGYEGAPSQLVSLPVSIAAHLGRELSRSRQSRKLAGVVLLWLRVVWMPRQPGTGLPTAQMLMPNCQPHRTRLCGSLIPGA